MIINCNEFQALIKDNAPGFDGRKISINDKLTDLGLDSLGFATTLFAIEDRLNIKIDESYLSKLNGMSTVGDLVAVFATMGYSIEV